MNIELPSRSRANVRRVVGGLALVCAALIGGCGSDGDSPGSSNSAPAIVRGEPPTFAAAAEAYNLNVGRLSRLRAGAVVRMSFVEDGNRREEQGEGLVQAVAPDRLALSIRKVSTPLIWIGCDEAHSWWFDLTAEPVTAIIGSHETFVQDARRRAGLAVGPRDLAFLLGMQGIDGSGGAAGATQWSTDGRLLGITTRDRSGDGTSTRRVWVDPATFHARKVEWYDADGRPNLIADLEGEERVDAPALSGPRPVIPARVSVHHLGTQTFIRLDLSSAQTGRVSDGAFEFAELLRYHGAERVVDLEHQ